MGQYEQPIVIKISTTMEIVNIFMVSSSFVYSSPPLRRVSSRLDVFLSVYFKNFTAVKRTWGNGDIPSLF